MKIDINKIDLDNFGVTEGLTAGETCYRVNPVHIGCKWNEDNLHLRSSMWNSKGELISAGFKKFFNWQEHPEITPAPSSLENCTAIEKIDGSLLICSAYKGTRIIRTRGTFDVSKFDNGVEAIKLIEDTGLQLTDQFSYLYEWYSPEHKIVLDYGNEDKIWLVGCINHEDYTMLPQYYLDILAEKYNLVRPKNYHFNSLEQMLTSVKELKGQEGICLYYNEDKNIHKVKSAEYLKLHYFKNNMNMKSLIELIMINKLYDEEILKNYILEKFDWECYEFCKKDATEILENFNTIFKILDSLEIESLLIKEKYSNRKDMALYITSSFKKNADILFTFLDGREVSEKQLKRLIYEKLNLN